MGKGKRGGELEPRAWKIRKHSEKNCRNKKLDLSLSAHSPFKAISEEILMGDSASFPPVDTASAPIIPPVEEKTSPPVSAPKVDPLSTGATPLNAGKTPSPDDQKRLIGIEKGGKEGPPSPRARALGRAHTTQAVGGISMATGAGLGLLGLILYGTGALILLTHTPLLAINPEKTVEDGTFQAGAQLALSGEIIGLTGVGLIGAGGLTLIGGLIAESNLPDAIKASAPSSMPPASRGVGLGIAF